MECPKCQASNRSDALLCIHCGEPLTPGESRPPIRKKVITIENQTPHGIPDWIWEQHADLLADLQKSKEYRPTLYFIMRRFVATLIDHVIVAFCFTITIVITWLTTRALPISMEPRSWILPALVLLMIHFMYTVLFQMFISSTPGYWILNLAVVYFPDIYPALPLRIIVFRWLLAILLNLCLGLSIIWSFIDSEHRFLHDRITGTRVIPLHIYNRILDISLKE